MRPTTMHGHQNPSQHKPNGRQQPQRLSLKPGDIFSSVDGYGLTGTGLLKSFMTIKRIKMEELDVLL